MIGFRLKFDDISKSNLKEFLLDYINKFDFFEIKFTNNLLKENKFRYLLELSKEYAAGRYSIHLPKDFFSKEFDDKIKNDIIQILKSVKCREKISLIVHMPYNYDSAFLKRLSEVAKKLKKYSILLENEKILMSNLQYLKRMDFVISYLIQKEQIDNIGICFDIGHLQYGILQEGILSQTVYDLLNKSKYFLKYIRECHIHDYNEERDHLQLKQGIIKLDEVSKFIIGLNNSFPIIIETDIINPNVDGKEQVEIVKTEIINKEGQYEYKTNI